VKPGDQVTASSSRPGARARTHTLGTVTCGHLDAEEEDAIVHAIKDLFDAEELSEEQWAEYKRTHPFETWDFCS
jgi:hypothetical protein